MESTGLRKGEHRQQGSTQGSWPKREHRPERESRSEQECGPKRAQAQAMGGKGESMKGGSDGEGVEARVLKRTLVKLLYPTEDGKSTLSLISSSAGEL